MSEVEIRILPEADDFLCTLSAVLVNEGYKPTYTIMFCLFLCV